MKKTLSEREAQVWQAYQESNEKVKVTSQRLRDPNAQPCIPTATPEWVRQVVARVNRKISEGWQFPKQEDD